MRIEKITYEQLFPIPNQQFANVRLGMEITIDDIYTPDAYESAKKLTNEAFNKMFPSPPTDSMFYIPSEEITQPIPTIQYEKTSQEERIKAFAQDISKEPTIERLGSWNKLVSQYKNYLEEPYQKRMEELSK